MADLLLLAEALDDEDFILLSIAMKEDSKAQPRKQFDIDTLSFDKILDNFRFEKPDLHELCTLLQFPEKVTTSQRFTASGFETLCITLRRLIYPNRLTDLEEIFHRSQPELSALSNWGVQHIFRHFGHLLQDIEQPWFLNALQIFIDAIQRKGGPLENCFGFIDGTVRAISRPGHNQQDVFNGHKRAHALKFQSVVVPNGLILNLSGPYEGRRHDSFLLRESNLLDKITAVPALNGLNMYGDSGYFLHPHLITPFAGALPETPEGLFNQAMSRLRQCVEWGFSKVLQYFAFVDFRKNLKLYLQPVGTYFVVATLLTNCHTCKYGNQTSSYFGVPPPDLDQYLT